MAIAYDNATHSTYQNSTSNTLSHTTSGTDRILKVYVFSVSDIVTGVTYGGVPMTQVQKQLMVGAAAGQYIYEYILVNPASGANNVVTSSSSNLGGYTSAVSYTGAKQTGQPDASNKQATTPTTSLTTSLTTIADNCWLTGCAYHNSTISAGTGAILRGGSVGVLQSFDSNGAKSPAGSHSIQTTGTTSDFAGHVVSSIAPASTDVTVSATVVSATFSAPASSISGGAIISPNALTATFSVQSATELIDEYFTPAQPLTASFSIPTPNIITPDALVNASVLSSVFSTQAPYINIFYPDVTVTPNVQNLTFSIQTPTTVATRDTIIQVNTQSAVFSTNLVTIYTQKSETVAVGTLSLYFSIITPKKVGGLWSQVPRETGDWTPVPRIS